MLRRRTIEKETEHLRGLLREGRPRELVTAGALAVTRFPSDPELNLLYGTGLALARPESAAWQIAAAISIDTSDGPRVIRAAALLLYLGQLEAARNYVEHAKTLPGDEAFRAVLVEVDAKLLAVEGLS